MDVPTWQNLLEEHHTLLTTHLDTLNRMRQSIGEDTSSMKMLHSCAQQTETVLQTYKVSAFRFLAELQSTTKPQTPEQSDELYPSLPKQPEANRTARTGIYPTPAEQILQQEKLRRTVIRTKRKTSGPEAAPAPAPSPALDKPRKRVCTASRSGIATPTSRPTRSTASPCPPAPTVEDDSEDDSFLRAVEAKLKAKEEKMWKDMVKKRKRSDEGFATSIEPEQSTPTSASRPRKKTRKSKTQAEGEVEIQPAYIPKTEKTAHKRSSPATEYMESILSRADAKRQRATRSGTAIVR